MPASTRCSRARSTTRKASRRQSTRNSGPLRVNKTVLGLSQQLREYLALNNDRPLFHNNPRLRRAVNFAIDRGARGWAVRMQAGTRPDPAASDAELQEREHLRTGQTSRAHGGLHVGTSVTVKPCITACSPAHSPRRSCATTWRGSASPSRRAGTVASRSMALPRARSRLRPGLRRLVPGSGSVQLHQHPPGRREHQGREQQQPRVFQ